MKTPRYKLAFYGIIGMMLCISIAKCTAQVDSIRPVNTFLTIAAREQLTLYNEFKAYCADTLGRVFEQVYVVNGKCEVRQVVRYVPRIEKPTVEDYFEWLAMKLENNPEN